MGDDQFAKLKRLRDIDSVSLFLKGLSWALPFLCLLGFIYGFKLGGIRGALIGMILCVIISIIASLVTMIISHKFGEIAGFLYRGPKANWSIKDQFEGDLNQVRYHKMNKRFAALATSIFVIDMMPDSVTLSLKLVYQVAVIFGAFVQFSFLKYSSNFSCCSAVVFYLIPKTALHI